VPQSWLPLTAKLFLLRPVHLARVLYASEHIKRPWYLHFAQASVCRVLERRDDGEPQAAIVDVEFGIEHEQGEISENCAGASFIAVRGAKLPCYHRYNEGLFTQVLVFIACNRRRCRSTLPPELVRLVVHEFVFLQD
jgi:hypothetical protein